jgi:hypothetical protein
VLALPEELQSVPDFGVECSLGLASPLAEPRLCGLLLHATLELKLHHSAHTSQDPAAASLVTITHNASPHLKNIQALR